jgi:hypothetical protein
MALGLPRLMEELWRELPHRPTLSERWVIRPRGANLAEEKPRHLVHVDLRH